MEKLKVVWRNIFGPALLSAVLMFVCVEGISFIFSAASILKDPGVESDVMMITPHQLGMFLALGSIVFVAVSLCIQWIARGVIVGKESYYR